MQNINDLIETQKKKDLNDLDEENKETKKMLLGIYITILRIRLKCRMMLKRTKMNTLRCMENMRTTSSTKTKKMKMKMEIKFIV